MKYFRCVNQTTGAVKRLPESVTNNTAFMLKEGWEIQEVTEFVVTEEPVQNPLGFNEEGNKEAPEESKTAEDEENSFFDDLEQLAKKDLTNSENLTPAPALGAPAFEPLESISEAETVAEKISNPLEAPETAEAPAPTDVKEEPVLSPEDSAPLEDSATNAPAPAPAPSEPAKASAKGSAKPKVKGCTHGC